ncbi:MAG: DUF3800 domain-containing protein [Candidatus Altiarchaeota archaeon]
MYFAYLDESGDFGKKKGASKIIVDVILIVRQRKPIEKIINDARTKLFDKKSTRKWISDKGGEIKHYAFPDKNLLAKIYKSLVEQDIQIIYCVTDKSKTEKLITELKFEAMMSLFFFCHKKKIDLESVKVCSDKDFLKYHRNSKFKKKHLKHPKDEFLWKVKTTTRFDKNEHSRIIELRVHPKDSKLEYCLQAADLIAGAIFQKYEHGNPKEYNLIKKKIFKLDEIEKK